MPSLPSTLDAKGIAVQAGDSIRILAVTLPPDMDDDDRDMIDYMIGSVCEIDKVDTEGLAWVTMWWSCTDGVATSTVALSPQQMEKVEPVAAHPRAA